MCKKMRFFSIFGFVFLIPLAIMVLPSFSWGQEYPTKPIDFIAPFPPGGLGPLVASLVAEEAKKYRPQPLVLIHKPGAGGTIGAYYVGKAVADGYTLMLTAPTTIVTAHLMQNFEFKVEDFDYIAGIVSAPIRLAVQANAPWKNLTQLVDYAKKNPGVVTCGNPGTHTATHLHMMRFEKMTGIRLTHVPFKGSADAMTALAGGHTMMNSGYPGEAEPLVDAGKVRVLSILDAKRSKFYPNVPTASEEGFGMAVVKSWRAAMGPKGIPKPILTKLEDTMKKITADSGFIGKAEKLKISVEFMGGEELKRELQKDAQEFSEIVKEIKSK